MVLSRQRLYLFIVATFATVAVAQSDPMPDENAHFEQRVAHLGLHRNLHSLSRPLPDGSKGLILGQDIPEPGLDEVHPPSGVTAGELRLHDKICGSAIIVVAKQTGSVSFITNSKTAVYTRHHFHVLRVLQSSETIAPGSDISVLQLGGTVLDGGERLHMEKTDDPLYASGGTFLLFLKHPVTSSRKELFVERDGTSSFEFVSGRLRYKAAMIETSLPFTSGETVADVSRVLATVEKRLGGWPTLDGCPIQACLGGTVATESRSSDRGHMLPLSKGNVLGYTDAVMGSWAFGYDTLNRLVKANRNAPPVPVSG